jgi:hypothetical protein
VRDEEPNDEPRQARAVPIPSILEGAIARPGDVDFYRFRVEQGEKLAFEIETLDTPHPYFAPRLGVADSEGREVCNNLYRIIDGDGDDWIKHLEAKVIHTFENGGDYYLSMQDLTFRNGNPRFGYRVLIRRQIPHVGRVAPKIFRVSGSSTEIEEDRLNLVAGQARKLTFLAEREEGFAGDLVMSVENPPPGVESYAASVLAPAAFANDGEVIEGRYENRGTIGKDQFRPQRHIISLVLGSSEETPPTAVPRLVRFVVRPVLQGEPGPRVAVYELPLMVVPRPEPGPPGRSGKSTEPPRKD